VQVRTSPCRLLINSLFLPNPLRLNSAAAIDISVRVVPRFTSRLYRAVILSAELLVYAVSELRSGHFQKGYLFWQWLANRLIDQRYSGRAVIASFVEHCGREDGDVRAIAIARMYRESQE
jgi:hypothetical protein